MRMKRVISGIISVALCAALYVPALAADSDNLYKWPADPTAENIWTDVLKNNGGSWSSGGSAVEFDSSEKALKLNDPEIKDGWWGEEYINCALESDVADGQLDITFKMKSNGAYFGVILDSGNKDTSTVAFATNPWGDWGGNYIKILAGGFPYTGTKLTESDKLGMRTDTGFGEWLTVRISAKAKEMKYDLQVNAQDGSSVASQTGLSMTGNRIKGIIFAHYEDGAAWDTTTYVKDIEVNYKADWKAPKTDQKLYTWQENLTETTVWSNGMEKNGGSYNSYAVNPVTFDSDEQAIILDNNDYEYFNYNFGGEIVKGKINLSFKFKTNGDRLGIILDSGEKDTSTVAFTVHPWGSDNVWDGGTVKTYSGAVGYGSFPWNSTDISESLKLGQHSDNGFDDWLNVYITAMPGEEKYDLMVTDGEDIIAECDALDMNASVMKGIVFVHYDEMDWDAKTYIKDIMINYEVIHPRLKNMKFIDYEGKTVANMSEVSPALGSIELDFGTKDVIVRADEPITLSVKDDTDKAVALGGSVKNGVYVIENIPLLKEKTKYVLKVPKSVATSDGDEMEKAFETEFATGELNAEIKIKDITENDNKIDSLESFKAAGKVKTDIQFVNKGSAPKNILVAAFYYSGNKMIYMDAVSAVVSAGAFADKYELSVADNPNLELDSVDKVSICLWDTLTNMIPYCASVDFEAQPAN